MEDDAVEEDAAASEQHAVDEEPETLEESTREEDAAASEQHAVDEEELLTKDEEPNDEETAVRDDDLPEWLSDEVPPIVRCTTSVLFEGDVALELDGVFTMSCLLHLSRQNCTLPCTNGTFVRVYLMQRRVCVGIFVLADEGEEGVAGTLHAVRRIRANTLASRAPARGVVARLHALKRREYERR